MKFFKRKKIFIFGCGSGGKSALLSHKRDYYVAGFIDNNKELQGKKINGIEVFSPEFLRTSIYDDILIASDYASEITRQLIDEYRIPQEKIKYNSLIQQSRIPTFEKWVRKVKLYFYNRTPYWLACCFFNNCFMHSRNTLLRLLWLDKQYDYVLKIVNEEKWSRVYSSRFVDKPQFTKFVTIPSVKLYLFHNCVTTTTSRSWILDKSRIVIERVKEMDISIADYSTGQIQSHNIHFSKALYHPVEIISEGILLSGVSDTNYYHWLIEILPQIEFLETIPDTYRGYPIYISENIRNIPAVYQLFKELIDERKVKYLKSNVQYRFKKIVIISSPNFMCGHLKLGTYSPVECSYFRKESLDYIRKNVLKNSIVDNDDYNDRIFLARKGLNRSYNQDEVIKLLTKHDFKVIYIEEYSIEQQCRYIYNASMIIAPTGAALANLIFAKPNTKALYWAAEENGHSSCFSNIAELYQIQLDCITYQANVYDTRATYHAEYEVSIMKIEHWLYENI